MIRLSFDAGSAAAVPLLLITGQADAIPDATHSDMKAMRMLLCNVQKLVYVYAKAGGGLLCSCTSVAVRSAVSHPRDCCTPKARHSGSESSRPLGRC